MKIQIQKIEKITKGEDISLEIGFEVIDEKHGITNLLIISGGEEVGEILGNEEKMKQKIIEKISEAFKFSDQDNDIERENTEIPKDFKGLPTEKEVNDFISKKNKG